MSTECRWCAPAPSLWVCSVPFSLPLPSFLLCLWCIAFEYGFISRFKGVFRGFWGADVYLYRFRVLRGLWGFCAREVFGGLEACCVLCLYFISFASVLSLSHPFFFFAYLLELCLCCPWLVLFSALFVLVPLWGLCFLFPFRTIRKKKGRNSLRPRLSCCGLLYLAAALYSSYSSDVSPFIS